MKKVVFIMLLAISCLFASAQNEKVGPTYGVALDRIVSLAFIEDTIYRNVIVELKAARLGDLFDEGVRIVVRDAETGKKKLS